MLKQGQVQEQAEEQTVGQGNEQPIEQVKEQVIEPTMEGRILLEELEQSAESRVVERQHGQVAPASLHPSEIVLEGACNVRDLGGYPVDGGGMTARGRLYRADGLHRLTTDSARQLLDRGVRHAIDLRSDHEVQRMPSVFAVHDTVAYTNISLIHSGGSQSRRVSGLAEMYVNILDESGEQIRLVLERILAAEGEAVVFHCTAGKDRTGVIAALLLDLAGVGQEEIAADYARTGSNIEPLLAELMASRPEAVSEEIYAQFLLCEPAFIMHMLQHLHDEYGGAGGYLRHIGMTGSQAEALRRILVEDVDIC